MGRMSKRIGTIVTEGPPRLHHCTPPIPPISVISCSRNH